MPDDVPTPQRPPIQISLAVMLLVTMLFAVASAGLFYAARIPEIQDEISLLTGQPSKADHTRRGPQIAFILFTFTSPMLLAIVVSTFLKFARR